MNRRQFIVGASCATAAVATGMCSSTIDGALPQVPAWLMSVIDPEVIKITFAGHGAWGARLLIPTSAANIDGI